MKNILKKIILSAVLTISFISVTQAQYGNAFTGSHSNEWTAIYRISGIAYAISDTTLAGCNQKLAAVSGTPTYTLILPCNNLFE